MSWRDRYPGDIGRFRDAEFIVETDTRAGGRRGALHEYPEREIPWGEDTGRRARRFTLNCFVLGPAFDQARDRLIQALEKPGPGTLVHPHYGTHRVIVLDEFTVENSTRRGGIATFRITFSEAGTRHLPDAEADTAAVVQADADAAAEAAANSFLAGYSVDGRPAWVVNAASERLQAFTDTIANLRNRLPSIPAEVTDFVAHLDDFSVQLSGLIRDPATLAAEVLDLVAELRVIAERPVDAVGVYQQLYDFGADAPAVPETTANRTAQAANQAAIHRLVRGAAGIEAARTAAGLQLGGTGGITDAAAARELSDSIAAQLDTLALDADDESYRILYRLRADVVTDLRRRALGLPDVISRSFARAEPAVVLAWRLYADAARGDDIVDRNGIADPNFVPGGEPLQVLTQ